MAERTVAVNVKMRLAGFIASSRAGTKALSEFRGEAQKLANEGRLDAFANRAALAAGGLTLALGYLIKTTAEFEAAMSKVSAATNASAADMEKLRQAAIEAGRTTAFSATEAAGAITELAKAGLSTQDILGGGLEGALNLAAAGELAVADAAEIAATAMVQFGLAGNAVPHVADLLAAAAGKAQGDVGDMAMALKQGGLVAAQMGLSIEETTGTLAAFASAGLLGSDAGTSLKTALLMLANPTDKARELMGELGLQVYDAQGNFVGMSGMAGQLRKSLSGLTQEQRNQALATIFGADAIRAAAILYEQGADGVTEWTKKVNAMGYAEQQAAKKMDNLLGDLKKLKGALESGLIESGEGANAALRGIVQSGTDVVNFLGSMPPALQQTMVWTAAVSAGALLLTAGWIKAADTISNARTALEGMGAAGERASRGIGALGRGLMVGGAFVGSLVAAGIAAKLLTNAIGPLYGRQINVAERNIDMLAASLQDFATAGEAAGELAKTFGADLSGLAVASQQLGEAAQKSAELKQAFAEMNDASGAALGGVSGLGDAVYDLAATEAAALFEDLDSAMMQLVANGGPHQAAFAKLAAEAAALGVPMSELLAQMPQYAQAALAAQLGNTGLAQGFGTVEGNAKLMAESLLDAMNAGRSLTDILNELNGAAMGFASAEIKAEEGIDKFTDAINESNGSMDVSNEKGRAAKKAMLELVTSAAEVAQAKYEETGSVDEASAVYDEYIGQLRKSMLAAGMSEKEVDELLKAYAKMPDSVFTDVDNNADDASNDVDRYTRKLRNIPEYRTTTLYVSEQWTRDKLGADFADGGVVEYYASGGVRENHRAQILPAGAMRVWAEPETGGEAYIPMGLNKRNRSEQIWAEVGRRFGMFQAPAVMQVPQRSEKPTIANVNVTAVNGQFHLSQVEDDLRYRSLT